jgi:tyrosyl-tRNA synthetase
MNIIYFLKDIGKYYRVGNLINKESISSRLNSEDGISFTEFCYTML